jgi:Holliday junction resolvase-like predicted endonuclease
MYNRVMNNRKIYKYVCKVCGKSFTGNYGSRYCSDECRNLNLRETVGRFSTSFGRSATETGTISELYACLDLMKKGYDVFRAVSGGQFCDLIAYKNNKFYRVEVRTGYRGSNGKITFPRKRDEWVIKDIYAVYISSDDVVVYLDTKDISKILEI